MLGSYQALSGAARRSWAVAHPDELRSFIRAYVAASAWLADDRNRAEASTIYAQFIPDTPDAVIAKAWDAMLSKTEGFQPRAKFDPAGAQTALEVRKQYGVPTKDLPDWRTYVDETFYDEALKAR
jgi:ABC-type nitrate/sulfonate/bicarbonate transport system substrate-binding protein